MAACGFGQLLKRNYRLEVMGKKDGPKEEITLVGPSCYSQDILATNVLISIIDPGDVICFYNCGSYGASFSPSDFLGLTPAQEYFQAGP
jgi:diaminopimelate decarboxylase